MTMIGSQLAPTDMLDWSVLVIDKHEEVSIPIPAAPTPHSPTVTAIPDRAHRAAGMRGERR